MTTRELERRLERWRRLLTPEWRLTIVADPPEDLDEPEEAYNARVQSDQDYTHARIWVREAFYRDAPLGEVDVTIVHELTHLLMREVRRTLDLVNGQIHRDVHTLLEERFESEEERLVERLARIIALTEHPAGILYGVDRPPQ